MTLPLVLARCVVVVVVVVVVVAGAGCSKATEAATPLAAEENEADVRDRARDERIRERDERRQAGGVRPPRVRPERVRPVGGATDPASIPNLVANGERPRRAPTQQNPTSTRPEERASFVAALAGSMKASAADRVKAAAAAAKMEIKGDPMTAVNLCMFLVIDCTEGTALGAVAAIDGCLAAARTCTTETPWLSETAPCCHSSCLGRYRARVAQLGGTSTEAGINAFTDILVSKVGSCMPGVASR
jgi:hypothetical protein